MENGKSLDQELVDSFFEIVNGTCQDEFKDQIIPALRRRYEKPPTSSLNQVLGLSLTDLEVRSSSISFPPYCSLHVSILAHMCSPPNPHVLLLCASKALRAPS